MFEAARFAIPVNTQLYLPKIHRGCNERDKQTQKTFVRKKRNFMQCHLLVTPQLPPQYSKVFIIRSRHEVILKDQQATRVNVAVK